MPRAWSQGKVTKFLILQLKGFKYTVHLNNVGEGIKIVNIRITLICIRLLRYLIFFLNNNNQSQLFMFV